MEFLAGSANGAMLERPCHLTDVLTKSAIQHPAAGIYFASDADFRKAAFLNHSQLLTDALRMLGALQALGLKAGSPVAVVIDHGPDFVRVFWACVLGGYLPCVIAPTRTDAQRWREQLRGIDSTLQHPTFVCDEGTLAEMPPSLTSIDCRSLDSPSPAELQYRCEPSDVAMLMLTSGSTGIPKAVALTQENVISSVVAKIESRGFTSDDLIFNWIGFDHVVALIEAHVLAVYLGVNQINVNARSILADPLQFIRIIDHYRATTAFTPNFLLGKICTALKLPGRRDERPAMNRWDLTCVRHIFSGGEANSVATGREFLNLLGPFGLNEAGLLPGYGMTETCAGATYSTEFYKRDAEKEFASVGVPVRGFDVRIVDEEEQQLPSGHDGHLQVRGPMVFSRYYNDPDATASAFTPDGWFRTGDMARTEADGRVTLVGRSKDSIIVSGVNYFAQELEIALHRLDGIDPAYVAAFPTREKGGDTEQLVVAFAADVTSVAAEAALVELVSAVRNTAIMLWGFRPSLVLALSREAFPKTNLGKIQRSLMRRRLESGTFTHELEAMREVLRRHRGEYIAPAGDIEKRMVSMIAKMLGIEEATLSVTDSFFDLGGTSLEILQLTRLLEESFELDVTLATVLQNPTVRQLARLTDRAGTTYDAIVTLQAAGKKTPLFLVHPGDGGTFVFVNLAKYFSGERPVFAFRPRGFDPGERHFETFEEMVGCYVDALHKVQPSGPYILIGYSLGGSIAFEMARELERLGEQIEFLGCIDGIPCGDEVPPAFGAAMLGAAHLLTTLHKRHFAVWSRMVKCMQDVSRAHRLAGTVDTITVFRTSGLPEGADEGRWAACLENWSTHVRTARYLNVPGDHLSVLAPKNVARFHAILRGQLQEAETARSTNETEGVG
ncbi:non-ribosomal peptide synthetase [Steroidobacter agaridevorans]|uniref:non-ribosomal peptide synthetase n=1 Tax=Steroidobacter agaridevorans TaxID=2695856 RepID=UPI00132ABD67|nr:non-ribosomal peptide synthetase [Steroidobacter agaridevorans]GFE91897.1 peptide synthase [Steroidobacter agaridevorans]